MSNIKLFPISFDLQLFAEGGDGGTTGTGETGVNVSVAGTQTAGVKQTDLKDIKYGVQEGDVTPAAEVETVDRGAKFEALIKGEYKDLYDARVQDTVQKRLKNTRETVEKYESLTPVLETLSKKYGVDPSDIKALSKAIEDDDAYYEDEAYEKGLTVEQLKSFKKMERENAELKKQMDAQKRQENADKVYAKWMNEAETTKGIYPQFNLETEMQNEQFVGLLRANIDVRTAYEVVHKDDIISGAMQFAAKKVEEKISDKIRANGLRPTENGSASRSTALSKSDVSTLSKADRDEIARRVARGERISFTK